MTAGSQKIVHAEGSLIVTGHVASETLRQIYEQKKEEIRKRFPSFFIENMLNRLQKDAETVDQLKNERFGDGQSSLKSAAGWNLEEQYGVLAARQIGGEGFFASLWHLLEEVDMGCEVQLDRVPIFQETIEICDLFDINPFEVPSGENLIIACRRGAELSWFLNTQGIANVLIGVLLPPPARRIEEGDHTRYLDKPR